MQPTLASAQANRPKQEAIGRLGHIEPSEYRRIDSDYPASRFVWRWPTSNCSKNHPTGAKEIASWLDVFYLPSCIACSRPIRIASAACNIRYLGIQPLAIARSFRYRPSRSPTYFENIHMVE